MNIKRKLQTSPLLIGITLAGEIEIIKTADRPSQLIEALEKAKGDVKNFTHVAIARGFNLATKPTETRKAPRKAKELAPEPEKTPDIDPEKTPDEDPEKTTDEDPEKSNY